MTILVISISAFFVVVWIMGVGNQVGYFSFLGRKIGFTGRRISLLPSNENEGRKADELFERRLLIQKSRRLLVHGLFFGFAGVLAGVILFIVATHFGTIY